MIPHLLHAYTRIKVCRCIISSTLYYDMKFKLNIQDLIHVNASHHNKTKRATLPYHALYILDVIYRRTGSSILLVQNKLGWRASTLQLYKTAEIH
jgi:hypothetical protein